MSEYQSLLERLTNAYGISGFEAPVAAIVREELGEIADITSDNLGSMICCLHGAAENAPKVALAGHMDEIGFMVKNITSDGYIKLQSVGGWWDQVLLGQRVIVQTHLGNVLGVIGAKPPHLLPPEKRNDIVKLNDMFVDIGASNKEQVEELGVRVGDSVVPDSVFTELSVPNRVLNKAFDNRVGVALFIHALQQLKDTQLPCELYGVGTVMEEVGLRGATTTANAIQPDIALILETSIAGDVPGISDDESAIKLGGGATVYLMDGSMIAQLKLRDLVTDVAKELDMPLQVSILPGGGTDGGKFHLTGNGVPSIVLAVPTRHIHSHSAILDMEDYKATLDLLCALIQKLDAETVARIKSW